MLTLDDYREIVYHGRLSLDAAWDERQHPRDKAGRFTSAGLDWRATRNTALTALRAKYQTPVTTSSRNGDKIIVSYSGLRHALNKGIPNPHKTLLALHIQELIGHSTKTKTVADRYGRKDPASVTHYATRVAIDGESFDVDIVVRNHNDGKRYYDHFALVKKPTSASTRVHSTQNAPPRSYSGLELSLSELDAMVKAPSTPSSTPRPSNDA